MADFWTDTSSTQADALASQDAGSAHTLFITWVGLLGTIIFMARRFASLRAASRRETA